MLLLVAGIAAIATAAGAVWGLEKVDSGLTTIEDNTQEIANDLRVVRGANGVAAYPVALTSGRSSCSVSFFPC